jgi:hypothetical protein
LANLFQSKINTLEEYKSAGVEKELILSDYKLKYTRKLSVSYNALIINQGGLIVLHNLVYMIQPKPKLNPFDSILSIHSL